MADNTEPVSITHNAAANRFEARIGSHRAVCEYRIEGERMIFTHTFVPPELRGGGIAAQLVRAALEFAKTERRKVVPACSYVEVFIQRHREFQSLLAGGRD